MYLLHVSGQRAMSPETTSTVIFDRVSKSFGPKQVLHDVSFEVPAGEILCILGRSGTGKSVTLKLLISLLKPDHGQIWVDGTEITSLKEAGLTKVRRKMGFLFQDAALFDSLTLYENLALPLHRLTDKTQEEIDSVVDNVLRQVGLAADKQKMPSNLSGGMRKRAGLARALVLEPKVLLADEPSSGLDRITAAEIDELLLKQKAERGTTVIVVTHDVHGARRVGDRFAVFDKGDLVAFGTASDVERSENEIARRLISEH
jgi:phospholipid/cholesterol/gamma-HCH transport system ATP-binding protein